MEHPRWTSLDPLKSKEKGAIDTCSAEHADTLGNPSQGEVRGTKGNPQDNRCDSCSRTIEGSLRSSD
eukprot:8745320-Prorocentrum_lima.AAC.1